MSRIFPPALALLALLALLVAAAVAGAQSYSPSPPAGTTRFDRFDSDPGWSGQNNRHRRCEKRTQDFGYQDTRNAGDGDGEVGGRLTTSYRQSSYARPVGSFDLDDKVEAKGRFRMSKKPTAAAAKFGFFNSDLRDKNDTPLPSSFFVSLNDKRGDEGDRITIEMETTTAKGARYSLFRRDGTAGSPDGNDADGNDVDEYDNDRFTRSPDNARAYDRAQTYDFVMTYDPNEGPHGAYELTVEDEKTIRIEIPEYMRQDNVKFNRFGLVNGAGLGTGGTSKVYFADIRINDSNEDSGNLRNDWTGQRNRGDIQTCEVEAAHDFGYAGGRVGGFIPAPERQDRSADDYLQNDAAWYGHSLANDLQFDDPLYMKGRLRVDRSAQDSATYLGWFGKDSVQRQFEDEDGDKDDSEFLEEFVGIRIEGRTQRPLAAQPMYASRDLAGSFEDSKGNTKRADAGDSSDAPRLYPGRTFDVEFYYDPNEGEYGVLHVRVDGGEWFDLPMKQKAREIDASLEVFGIHSASASGIGRQWIYLDNYTHTVREP